MFFLWAELVVRFLLRLEPRWLPNIEIRPLGRLGLVVERLLNGFKARIVSSLPFDLPSYQSNLQKVRSADFLFGDGELGHLKMQSLYVVETTH